MILGTGVAGFARHAQGRWLVTLGDGRELEYDAIRLGANPNLRVARGQAAHEAFDANS